MNRVDKQTIGMLSSKLREACSAVAGNKELIEKYTEFEDLTQTLDKMEDLKNDLEEVHEKYGYGVDEMNKEKILDQLMDIRELTGGADVPVSVEELNGDLMAIRDISTDSIKELNSKPVMPPAFVEWKKQYLNNKCELLYWIAELENGGEESKQDNDLSDWLFENGIDDTFFHRYQMCVEAIIHGYEVEK